jgi:hypothetical protein
MPDSLSRKERDMTEELDPISIFVDSVAGAIVAAKVSGKWRLNMPRIAAVGETLGIAPADLDEGGKHFETITARIEILGLSMPTKRDARLTAERLFGPRGKLAPDFLVKD